MRSLLVALAILLALPSLARADKAGPASAAVKTANETIDGLLKQKVAAGSDDEKKLAAKVTDSVRAFLDIDELGKRAMGDQWTKLKPDQQKTYLETLRGLIEANYVKGLRSNLDYTVEYTGETADKDGNITVTTKIKASRKNKPYTIAVDYITVKDGAKYRAFDVVTDGVGLVENYKMMFAKIVARDGFDGLIKRMKDKQAKL